MNKEQVILQYKQSLKETNKSNVTTYFKKKYKEAYDFIMNFTKALNKHDSQNNKNKHVTLKERIYCVEHNLHDRPLCQNCKTNYVCNFNITKNEYKKWCSPHCQASDKECILKTKQTKIKEYGSATYNGTLKARQTRLAHNNGHWHANDFTEKIKTSKLKKYGDENYVNKEKAFQTKIERYGTISYTNAKKAEQTKLKLYGDKHYNNRKKFKQTVTTFSENKKNNIIDKRKQTCLEKYGVENIMQLNDTKSKIKKTCLKKYGVEAAFKITSVKEASIKTIKEKSYQHILLNTNYVPMFTKKEYVENRDEHKKWQWKCIKCNTIFEAEYVNGQHHRCYKCWPNITSGTSLLEQEIRDYIRTLTSKKVYNKEPENKRIIENREIDIYIPSKNLAIEVDGLYYHSEDNGKGMMYHLHKTEECEKQGIHLIHIFEDEWLNKQNIVKSELNKLLGNSKTIDSNECSIEKISLKDKENFLENNCLQGNDSSNITFGLKHNDKIVAIMSFMKARFSKKYEYEISRYATALNVTVLNGSQKLLNHFEKIYCPKSLVTYVNRRWNNGEMYFQLGFKLDHSTKPSYDYIKNGCRYSKMFFKKNKLNKQFENYNELLSEIQNMKANGYSRIFDCGTLVLSKILEK